MSLIQGNTKVSAGGYVISNAARFDGAAEMGRTPGSAGNRRKYIFQTWAKLTDAPTNGYFHALLSGNSGASAGTVLGFGPFGTSTMALYSADGGGTQGYKISGTSDSARQLFRDYSAWACFTWDIDRDNTTANFYVNGVQIDNYNYAGSITTIDDYITGANQHNIGQMGQSSVANDVPLTLYLAQTLLLDGQSINAGDVTIGDLVAINDDGVAVPVNVSGLTYGTTGFLLEYGNSGDMGEDTSGNNNDFTVSGGTISQVSDTPTDNYATINLLTASNTTMSFHDGNLKVEMNNAYPGNVLGSIGVSTGKYYWEVTLSGTGSSSNGYATGVAVAGWANKNTDPESASTPYNHYIDSRGNYHDNGTSTSNSTTFTAGDIIGIALNCDDDEISYYKNNTLVGTRTLDAGETWFPLFKNSTGVADLQYSPDFGQLGYTYTAPTGFSALSTANLPAPTVADGSQHFNVVQYSGTGNVTRSVTGVGFQPDLVLAKHRSNASANVIANAVSGVNTFLATEQTAAESSFTNSIYGYLSSFDSDGFTLTPGSTNNNYWNESGINIMSYNWLAGNGTVSNTDGSVTSTVSVNATAGISLIAYTGTGSAATVGHGLGAEPQFIAVKGRTNVDSWGVYPGTSMGYGGQYRFKLNENSAVAAASSYWNDTDATSSVFTVNTDAQVNGSGVNYVALCFAEIPGFSRFTHFVGNGSSDGPFIHLGHKSRFFFIKEASSADDWVVFDTVRDAYNLGGIVWRFDSNTAEFDGRSSASRGTDILSNGIKLRTSNATINGSGVTYIVGSWAEHPFGGTGVAPVPAR